MNDKVPPKKARQGRRGFPVLMVLLGGLVLAGIAWVLAEIYGIYIDERQPIEMRQSSDAPISEGVAPQTTGDEGTAE